MIFSYEVFSKIIGTTVLPSCHQSGAAHVSKSPIQQLEAGKIVTDRHWRMVEKALRLIPNEIIYKI
jgi:hypothetical protein